MSPLRPLLLVLLLPTLAVAQAKTPKLLWKLDLASPSYGSGAIGDLNNDGDLVIVFGTYFNDEHLYAVRARTGEVLWKFKSEGGPWDASIALVDLEGDKKLEVLAADSSTGTLFCLDSKGMVLWKHKLPSSTDSPPAVADLDGDGKLEIVVGTMTTRDRKGRVIVLDAATRKEKWSASVPGHVQSEPALVDLDGDKVLDVIVTNWLGDKKVRALSGKDGKEMWAHPMAGDIYHGVSIVRHDGKVHVVANSTKGDVFLLNAKGEEIWKKDLGGYLFAPTTVADLDGDGRPEILVCSGRVHALDLDGKELWRGPDCGSIPRGVAVADLNGDGLPDVLFGGSDKVFRVLEGTKGGELFRFDAKVKGKVFESVDSAPLIADFDGDGTLDVFFVAGQGLSDKTRPMNYGRAFALSLGKGEGRWETFRGSLLRTGSLAFTGKKK